MIAAYQKGIHVLLGRLDDHSDEETRKNLQKFQTFVTDGLNGGFTEEVLDRFMTSARLDFELFCTLAQKPDLPQETGQQAVRNLTYGLDVCAPGVALNIEAATMELKALTSGISQNFVHELISTINGKILIFIGNKNICEFPGEEIHYAAALFNHVAHHFNLPKRSDEFIKTLPPEQLEDFERYFLKNVTPEIVVDKMAHNLLNIVTDFYALPYPNALETAFNSEQLGKLYRDFEDDLNFKLKPIFGTVDAQILFPACTGEDERYRLTNDIRLIAHCLARNLREAGIIEFKAAYVLGEKGEGIKIKQLGEKQFYVSTTYKISPEDKNTHDHQTLDHFVLQDMERGKALLYQLAQSAASNPAAKAAQNDFLNKMPASLVREMKDAPSQEKSAEIFEQAMSLPELSKVKDTVLL